MKILFINTGPWGTGSFTLVKCLADELLNLGHQVKIFFPDGNLASENRDEYYQNTELYKIWSFPIKKDDIVIENFPLMIADPHPRNPYPITFKNLSLEQQDLYETELKKEIFQLTREFQPDIIECHHIWYPAWILNQLGLRYFVTAHHSDQLGFHFDKKVREKAIASAHRAEKVIAISESVKKEVLELYEVDEEQVAVIANGYDKEVFKVRTVDKQAFLNELGIILDPEARIISFAGKISLTKGIDTLIQANSLLHPSQNIHFIVLGTGNLDAITQKMDPDSYNLKNVHFVGQQAPEMVAKIHNISNLGIMPSRSEGFGIACLEAMACGLPMIATRCGGPENFAVGKIIDAESASQLAEGIMDLLNLPADEQLKLKEQAITVAHQFSMQAITKQHIELYEQIISEDCMTKRSVFARNEAIQRP